MDTKVPGLDLQEEVTCSICLEYFQDAVIIPECGHNFCRRCLTRSWGESEAEASCPQCRQTFRPQSIIGNRQLANVAEIAQRWGPRGKSLCGTHREPLKLFCKDHESLLCVICDRSREHRGHQVIPLEEAFQEYKIKVGDCLKTQKEERERILSFRAAREQEMQKMLDLIQKEREKTVTEFRELRCWLEKQEKLLLASMEETKKEIVARKVKDLTKHLEELSSLDGLIQEMEEKQQQPATELLQDIRSTLKKYQAKKPFENPVAFLLQLKWTIWDYRDIHVFLKSVMKQLRDTVKYGLQLQKANVILDPYTAHPCLDISKDYKSIRRIPGDPGCPENPKRFEKWQFVLGCHGFSTGRHFWEVAVGDMGEWTVGIAKKSVNRKVDVFPDSKNGIWQVGRWGGKYQAAFYPEYPELCLTKKPKRIRVSLNCEGRQVAFFDAQTAALLYMFSEAPLAGEILLPSLFLGNDACQTHTLL